MEGQQQQSVIDQPEPELLYHYTDQRGLFGILESKCLWATHSQFLNDFSEYRIIFDALGEIIQNKLKNSKNANWIHFLNAAFKIRQDRGIFVSSFSGESSGDSLAMWRAYASNNCGFSMGFDRSTLKYLTHSIYPYKEKSLGMLNKCIYIDPDDINLQSSLKNIVEIVLPDLINPLEEIYSESDWNNPMSILKRMPIEMMDFADDQAALAACCKHIGFKEENEWRIILIDKEESLWKRAKFRQGKSMLIPYIEIDWKDKPTPIKRIVVGPTPNKDEAIKATKMLLAREGIPIRNGDNLNGIEVTSSRIPYRNW